jgi:hypothetical protein
MVLVILKRVISLVKVSTRVLTQTGAEVIRRIRKGVTNDKAQIHVSIITV